MAIHIYSIPSMSLEPERVFSGVRDTLSHQGSSLKSEAIELLEYRKPWFRLGSLMEGDLHVILGTMNEDGAMEALEEVLNDEDGRSIWGQTVCISGRTRNGGNSFIWTVLGLWTDRSGDWERWSAPELRAPSRGAAARATERRFAVPLSSRYHEQCLCLTTRQLKWYASIQRHY